MALEDKLACLNLAAEIFVFQSNPSKGESVRAIGSGFKNPFGEVMASAYAPALPDCSSRCVAKGSIPLNVKELGILYLAATVAPTSQSIRKHWLGAEHLHDYMDHVVYAELSCWTVIAWTRPWLGGASILCYA